MTASESNWNPDSWRTKPAKQQVEYDDPEELQQVLGKLKTLPPLVRPEEVDSLRILLAQCALGQKFLLQGGDCAELFDYCSSEPIENKLKVLLQMSLVMIWGARTGVVRIARMGGQYAKPRSKPTEIVDGQEINAFRGHNINGFDIKDRRADPQRLLGAYFHSAATMNYVRALLSSGFADLHNPNKWSQFSLEHVRKSETRREYEEVVTNMLDSLSFMRTIGADPFDYDGSGRPDGNMRLDVSKRQSMNGAVPGANYHLPKVNLPPPNGILNTISLYMSHEGLHLDYESCLTRPYPVEEDSSTRRSSMHGSQPGSGTSSPSTKYYNVGAHFLWIGDRTRELTGAHIEYFRGLVNPIGVKVGPTMEPEELIRLLDILDPNHEVGKITLITRFGQHKVEQYLKQHIEAVQATDHRVVWCCDPMHGNTQVLQNGVKTRHFEAILAELSKTFRIHKDCGSQLAGLHVEVTGDRVTECVGGSMELSQADLSTNYQTYCDPRLNYEQSLDVAFLIAKYFGRERSGTNSL